MTFNHQYSTDDDRPDRFVWDSIERIIIDRSSKVEPLNTHRYRLNYTIDDFQMLAYLKNTGITYPSKQQRKVQLERREFLRSNLLTTRSGKSHLQASLIELFLNNPFDSVEDILKRVKVSMQLVPIFSIAY